MEIKNYFAQDAQGNIMPSANCYLYLPDTTTLATGLIDGNGVPISNPFLASSVGQVEFGAPNGVYDLRVALGSRDWTIKVQCADIVQTMDVMDSILGSHAENPAVRNNGQPLQPGDETWNSTDKQPYWWDGSSWLALNSSAKSLEDSLASASGALKVVYGPPVGPAISVSGFLDRQGIWAGDSTEIQGAMDFAVAKDSRESVQLAPNKSYALNSGLILDISKISLLGNGSQLDFRGMTTGKAISVIGSKNPPYEQNLNSIEKLRLLGPGQNSAVGAWFFNDDDTTGEGPSRFIMRQCNTAYFGVGEHYKNRAYLSQIEHCEIVRCGVGVWGDVASDGGENMSRFGGGIYNGGIAVKMDNNNGAFHFNSVSIDYNEKIFEMTGGRIALNQCHVENRDFTGTPVTMTGNGTSIDSTGGWWLLSGPIPHGFDYFVDAGVNTSFVMRGPKENNLRTRTDTFSTGLGHVSVDDVSTFAIPENNRILNALRSKLADGGFEKPTIADDIYIRADTSPITSRHTGANAKLTISTAYPKTGLQSLAYQKMFGSGSISAIVLISVPVNSGDMIGYRYSFRKPLSSTGSITLSYSWVKRGVNADGVPVRIYSEDFASLVHTFTAEDSGWITITGPNNKVQSPSWATHFEIGVQGVSWAAMGEYIYFDDMTVDKVG